MTKLLIAILFSVIVFSACGSTANSNANVNTNTGAPGNVTIDANNLPPGLSTSPVPPSANTTPGIPPPGQANNVPKGATPTPGIPDPAHVNRPVRRGATPTPGIPSEEELRRQLRSPASNVNTPPPAGDNMMRNRPRPVNRPR